MQPKPACRSTGLLLMRKILCWLTAVFCYVSVAAQNPATTLITPVHNVVLPCGTTCTNISLQAPHIKQSDDYVLTRPAYVPFAYATPGGTEMTSIYTDDVFSSAIQLPFPFCFYGAAYNSVVMGSNAIITFDASNAGGANSWPLTTSGGSGSPVPIPYAGGTQNSSFSTYYPKASIMGPYHDIYPTTNGSGQRKIEWRVEGVTPQRRFIASYNSVPMFSCTSTYATSMIVIYEGTGVVEVYVHDKPLCSSWNTGLAILGIQNFNQNKAVAAEGKNCTAWGGAASIDSCYRFIPTIGISRFLGADLMVNGTVVQSTTPADTSTAAPGFLNINFPNVCPTADSTQYVIRVKYNPCNTEGTVMFYDTVYVKKSAAPTMTVSKTDGNCTTTGSITVNASGANPPLEYSINGGTTYQSSNVFNNVAAGTYNVRSRTVGSSCFATQQVTVVTTNNLTVSAVNPASVCLGGSVSPNVTGNATTYAWTPTTGVSNPAIASPTFSPQTSTTYTLTATLGTCTVQRTFPVTIFPGVTVNAGLDQSILAGDVIQLNATATAGTYTWTPPTGLSATNVLNPNANPAATTTYTLSVVNPQGCQGSDNVTITVIPYCIKPMEAFTPNGDGINDLWLITNGAGCLTKATASVFNRYGSKVFESQDYKNDWNGTYKGKPLPDGTYYYVISFYLINGKLVYLKGNLTILR